MSVHEIRPLTADDLPAEAELGRLAFGRPAGPPAHEQAERPGIGRLGAFDARGRLVGKAADLHHEQWWGGRLVTAADLAGVAVLPEARGAGVGRAVLTAVLAAARERGAAISALHPTTSGPYRALGWETAGPYQWAEFHTAALPRYRGTLQARPAEPADVPAVVELYAAVVGHRNGYLSRVGPPFESPTDALPSGIDGITLIEDDSRLVGYASWIRGEGYSGDALLTVPDALAVTPEAGRAVVDSIAGWASVTPRVRLRTVTGDAAWAVLPLELAQWSAGAWMHRPVDVVKAVESRGWRAGATGAVTFELIDAEAPWNAGTWAFEVGEGKAGLTPNPTAAFRLDTRAFAQLYCGSASGTTLARAGRLEVLGTADPSECDVLGGEPAGLLDYF